MSVECVAAEYRRHLAAYGYARAFRDGAAWYPSALAECRRMGRAHGVSAPRAAAVVAILSPRARWQTNLRAADMLLSDAAMIRIGARRRYRRRYGVLPAQVTRAQYAIGADRYSSVVTGPKVSAFYRNIMGDADIVTVDTIMAKAGGLGSVVSPKVRAAVVSAVCVLADEYGMSARDMQASVWCAFRGGGE
jgi:hypothetical protein